MDNDFELLAAIVEVTSHRKWEDYITERFLRPLRLMHTGFQGIDWGHRGADGMTSTAHDLLRWVRALEAGKVISPAISAELRRPLIHVRDEPPYEVHYGYGTRIYVRDSTVTEVMYSGSGDADNTSIARVLADGDVIIVLSSARRQQEPPPTWASYVATLIQPR
jgi:CubicO group peptidase (beta-lactamase class C family)